MLLFAAVTSAFGLARAYAVPPVPDVGLYLWLAGRVLDGAQIYRDIIEMNPPLIVWLNIPAVWLARGLHARDWVVFHTMVIVLVVLSVALCGRLLREHVPALRPSAGRWWLCAMAAALLVLPGLDFGQREHIMLALTLPYICAAAGRYAGSSLPERTMVLVGTLGGIGISIKPHFALLWLGLEALLTFGRPRSPLWARPESLAVAAVVATYGMAVLVFTPDYLPLLRRFSGFYGSYFTHPVVELVRTQGVLWMLMAFAVYLIVRPRGGAAVLPRVLLVAGAAFTGAALAQRKGWPYHFYPAVAIATLLVVLLLQQTIVPNASDRLQRGQAVAVAVLVATVLALGRTVHAERELATGADEEAADARALAPVVRRYAAGRTIMIFSPTHSIAFPLVNETGVRWGSRYISMWPIKGFLDAPTPHPPRLAAMENEFVHSTVSDLVSDPPALLIVDVSPIRNPAYSGFTYFSYFSRDARFAALLTEYDSLTDVRRYRVYRRVRTAPPPIALP